MIIGILGAGQLARMLALAGKPLGLKFIFLDPTPESCAADLGKHLIGDYTDKALLTQFAAEADIITYEFENVPVEIIHFLAESTPVYPPEKALAVSQDRITEKQFCRNLGIPTAAFATVSSLADLEQAMTSIGYPAILKTRRFGYDGKGQVVLRKAQDLADAWDAVQNAPCVVESFVPFDREVSIIASRSVSGHTVYYPLSENTHEKGILRLAKNTLRDPLQAQAEQMINTLLTALDYVGTIALELFAVDDQLIVNEFAPRVHNSGHWTIEGSETSQFENHLRAIIDWPLGATNSIGYAAMQNFIGGVPSSNKLLSLSQVHLHLYDKAARKGRKIAHATARTDSLENFTDLIALLTELAKQSDDS
ncbi:5-(carboxyamino)imidazole ribonucleotide synthase [methanotrophic endosymbiont of Bathymodiolus puteoserpentis (Logatchev)]|jgi:5-(carboxyamino)imidazole ribonucleotide synthase|uniref:5-(carboxyamino)imidazole ribonucleotide synthase n=1 Tax=methanotrophic endosymbiont of Bathymodiolus puteoserpentis (Logatchev) TaxID=343235 RepID=UPI0013C5A8AC|nr:5-(carboxyamino)imidazole ribonucleotide synthase [methanotrophic endosymbiont of Bathymodiolus puteoserpentis (Logatchev)]SHE20192.1 Phosphoribosylaminoimidazole carboxylase ATPase subunit [methanotrophic endosymbiont of Bathymodiolus puteoserpentis (Logatchev)]